MCISHRFTNQTVAKESKVLYGILWGLLSLSFLVGQTVRVPLRFEEHGYCNRNSCGDCVVFLLFMQ
jgi:hypothetical protein